MRNGSLWSDIVFENEVIFHEFDFETLQIKNLRSRNQASESTQLRVTRVFFLSLISRNFDDQLSSNFHRFTILCICWHTLSEKTGLWQLPIVSRVFKSQVMVQSDVTWCQVKSQLVQTQGKSHTLNTAVLCSQACASTSNYKYQGIGAWAKKKTRFKVGSWSS